MGARCCRIGSGAQIRPPAAQLGYERTVIAKAESGGHPPSAEVAAAYGKMFPISAA